MVNNEVMTADQVLGIILNMDLKEFSKLFATLEFNNGWKIIYDQVKILEELKTHEVHY